MGLKRFIKHSLCPFGLMAVVLCLQAQSDRGRAMSQKDYGEVVSGEAALRQALEVAPERVELRQCLGRVYYRQGRYLQATMQLELAVMYGADDAQTRQLLERCHEALGTCGPE